jgi:hypothetical protein
MSKYKRICRFVENRHIDKKASIYLVQNFLQFCVKISHKALIVNKLYVYIFVKNLKNGKDLYCI